MSLPETVQLRFAHSEHQAASSSASESTPHSPYGSSTPQRLKEGDIVLMDGGCTSRVTNLTSQEHFVFGKPTDRQRQIWDLEKKAQDAAFAAAKIGAPCEAVMQQRAK